MPPYTIESRHCSSALPLRPPFPRREGGQGVRSAAPIGIFDSGVGGLSVLQPLRELLPAEEVVYVADAAWCPYGPRAAHVIRQRVETITGALVACGVQAVVVACNSASTAALGHLRRRFPDVPFVGMEPAVKPAAARTQTGAIGVLATAVTARGEALARLVDRFGRDVTVHVAVPEGLVELVEQGRGNSLAAEDVLRPILQAFAANEVDVIVLGCTHYPFARPTIQRLVGPGVLLIDPAPAVARQVARVLGSEEVGKWPGGQVVKCIGSVAGAEMGDQGDLGAQGYRDASESGRWGSDGGGAMTFLTSGDPAALQEAVERLMPAGWAGRAIFGRLR